MTEPFRPTIAPFSKSYDLIHNADVLTYDEEQAIMDEAMYAELARRFGKHFTGKVENLHYVFKPERQIPKGSVAVPADNHGNPDALLIKND